MERHRYQPTPQTMKQMKNKPAVEFTAKQIQRRVRSLAKEINRKYAGKQLTVVCVLHGGVMFFTDLVKQLNMPVVFGFVNVDTYGNEQTIQQTPKLYHDFKLLPAITDAHVLIVDDIVDSGTTIKAANKLLREMKPTSVSICALLKKHPIKVRMPYVEFVGFHVKHDYFFAGYGMDDKGIDRNKNYIYRADRSNK